MGNYKIRCPIKLPQGKLVRHLKELKFRFRGKRCSIQISIIA